MVVGIAKTWVGALAEAAANWGMVRSANTFAAKTERRTRFFEARVGLTPKKWT
jgi:hypothetical protein